jgi:hypothetical protein
MPNIQVKRTITSISCKLNRLEEHVQQHSGINKNEAWDIDDLATDIAVTATRIAALARQAQGKKKKPEVLLRQVRRALGFTYP